MSFSSKFDVSRARSRRWQDEVTSIRQNGRECPGACHFVFRSASRATPAYVPRHSYDPWSHTCSRDVDERPEWQHPAPLHSVLQDWKQKSPHKARCEEALCFWTSHGAGKGRYGFSEGPQRDVIDAGAAATQRPRPEVSETGFSERCTSTGTPSFQP